MSNTQIAGVLANPERQEVTLLWSDRTWSVVDFKPIIAEGGVFTRLADKNLFARVQVIDRGEAISWPGEIDFHADMLWAASHTASDAHHVIRRIGKETSISCRKRAIRS